MGDADALRDALYGHVGRERPTFDGVSCLCGNWHAQVGSIGNEPMIECAVAPPRSCQRVDTRYLMIEDENDVTRVFKMYDGPLWVRGPVA